MASAVLAILNPKVWPVIDVQATRAIWGWTPSSSAHYYFKAYYEDLSEIRRAHYSNMTIHEVDNLAQGAGQAGRRFHPKTRPPRKPRRWAP